ncbi:MAG: hypothetical protein IT334_01630 [Thermomicrobiales bacterium]|nr:hypothetical protein [Thermomicrobiales bacterium]
MLAIVLLTACVGGSSPATPTPEPVSTTAPTPTLAEGTITVGMLADRIAAAWGSVETIRQERTVPIESGTPVASPEAIPSTRYITEIDANGNRRFTFEIGGMVMGELVAMAGDLWARGIWPIPLDATGEETAGGWLPVTPEAASADPVAAQIVTGMLAPYPPILGGLSTAERQRAVEDLGPRTIDGRVCHAYRIPSTTSTGQPFDVILSLDERDLPCALESIAFGESTVDTYTFNTEIVITKPE